MKIKFDTATMTEAEARGLSAMLAAMFLAAHPAQHGVTINVSHAPRPGETPETAIPGGRFDPNYPGVDFRAPAPDGYPVDPEDAPDGTGYPSQPQSVQRDVAGIPWDERIHASTKTTNKDGTWTRRRNTPDETFDKVMAELKAANTAMTMAAAAGLTAPVEIQSYVEMPANSTPQQVAEAFANVTTAAEAFTPPASVVIPAHVPAPPVPPVPVPPVPVAPTVDDKSAEAVEIMKAVNAKQVTADKLAEVVGKAGLKGLVEVFTASIEARRIIAAELAAL